MQPDRLLASFLCAAMEFQRRRRFRTQAEHDLHYDLLAYAVRGVRDERKVAR